MSEQKPLLSVIIPIYNVEEFVEECIRSVVTQDYPYMEIIAVNDGSTDNSAAIVERLAAEDSRIRLYNKPNGGLSDARNHGLDRANGEFITFIDSDDVLLATDVYSRAIAEFDKKPEIDCVQFDVVHKWESPEEHKRNYPFRSYDGKEQILEGYIKEWIHVSCCDKIFRRSIFKDIRFPMGAISEDIAIIPNLAASIRSLITTPIHSYGYRYRPGSISNSEAQIPKMVSAIKSNFLFYRACYDIATIRKYAMKDYALRLWNSISFIRRHNRYALDEFYNLNIFIRCSLSTFFKETKGLPMSSKLKIFAVFVAGPRRVCAFQKIFTSGK